MSARLLIANHIDNSLLRQADQRSFVQRIFWLAKEGDVLVLPSPPDEEFLGHVVGLLGIKRERLTILVAPLGRYEGRLLDPLSLTSSDLIERLSPLVGNCSELFCLWPSVQVAQLAARLRIEHAMPGAYFFSQGGDALMNSKATFRAFAAACGTPMPKGTVCRSVEELTSALSALIQESTDGVMVKQAHNGAAAGCALIRKGLTDIPGTAGRIWTDDLEQLDATIPDLWTWASAGDRFPVIVEEFMGGCQTVYFEFSADNSQVILAAAGALEYDGGRLVREHTPLAWDLPGGILHKGIKHARKLAEHYWGCGYRGYLSADGLLNSRGEFLFTEMNARVGGSLPLYGGIWHRVARRSEVVDRYLFQYLTPSYWGHRGTGDVLERLARAGVLYDKSARIGAMLGMPAHPTYGSYLLCLVTRSRSEQSELYNRIDAEFCGS